MSYQVRPIWRIGGRCEVVPLTRIIDKTQFSLVIAFVVLSAVVPTVLADRGGSCSDRVQGGEGTRADAARLTLLVSRRTIDGFPR